MRTRLGTACFVTAVALAASDCATVHNLPLNTPSANPLAKVVGSAVAAEAAELKREGDTDGRVTVREVECLAACAGAPMAQVNKPYHENLTPEKIDAILDSLD